MTRCEKVEGIRRFVEATRTGDPPGQRVALLRTTVLALLRVAEEAIELEQMAPRTPRGDRLAASDFGALRRAIVALGEVP